MENQGGTRRACKNSDGARNGDILSLLPPAPPVLRVSLTVAIVSASIASCPFPLVPKTTLLDRLPHQPVIKLVT